MEFVPLRSLQKGAPEVFDTLRKENGRIILTNKGQPTYLLVDLAGENVLTLVNLFDYLRQKPLKFLFQPILDIPEKKAEAHQRSVMGVKNFFAAIDAIKDEDNVLTGEDFTEMENLRSQTNLTREQIKL